ncbi:MAG TPA: GNAT family protein [Limnochordia bacterium]
MVIAEGEKVKLRPIEPADFPKIVAWTNDPEVSQFIEGEYPQTLAECPAWLAASRRDRHNQRFTITDRTGRVIGDIELDHITWRSGDAEMRVRIGERELWDQGYGSDAVCALLVHAFGRMRLHRIYLRVFRQNQRAIRCYQKCGFRKEGRIVRPGPDGKPVEVILMRILRDEFERRRRRGLIPAPGAARTQDRTAAAESSRRGKSRLAG